MTPLPRTLAGLTLALLLAVAAGGAGASQDVWRCQGNSYSSQPCTGGRLLDAADTRSDAHQSAARQVVERDRRLARDMAQDRHEREREWRQNVGTGLTGFGLPTQHAAAGLKPKDRAQPEAKPLMKKTSKAKPPKATTTATTATKTAAPKTAPGAAGLTASVART